MIKHRLTEKCKIYSAILSEVLRLVDDDPSYMTMIQLYTGLLFICVWAKNNILSKQRIQAILYTFAKKKDSIINDK